MAMDENRKSLDVVQVLTRHQMMVQAYAYAILRDFHLAEDAYQEVAVILVKQWETVPRGEGFVPWLREVTRRKALELRRKSARMPVCLSETAMADVAEAFEPGRPKGEDSDLPDVMARCVEKLQGTARTVLEMRYLDGESCERIAGRVNNSVQGVYGILKRARLALAECVDRARAAEPRGGLS
jgi:RNA polymerase sigma-70 factor (ECF subfamily)